MAFFFFPQLRCCRTSQMVKPTSPLVRSSDITRARCQQLHFPIPLNITVPTTLNPSVRSHKNCLCLCPNHNTSSCISPRSLFLFLSQLLSSQHFSVFSRALSSLWAASSNPGSKPFPYPCARNSQLQKFPMRMPTPNKGRNKCPKQFHESFFFF